MRRTFQYTQELALKNETCRSIRDFSHLRTMRLTAAGSEQEERSVWSYKHCKTRCIAKASELRFAAKSRRRPPPAHGTPVLIPAFSTFVPVGTFAKFIAKLLFTLSCELAPETVPPRTNSKRPGCQTASEPQRVWILIPGPKVILTQSRTTFLDRFQQRNVKKCNFMFLSALSGGYLQEIKISWRCSTP